MHWACALDIARQRHAAKNSADRLQGFLFRLVQERRHFLHVPGHQQKALAALGQATQFAAVVGCLAHGVAKEVQHLDNLIEQMPTTGGQARHVLEHDQAGRIVLPGLAHEPHAAQRQFIEGLVLGGKAQGLR
ncbi:hypothetical protein TU85_12150 [Pseudomonas helleri]|nr:hypothetical protein TU85_12150 [Pseudomonas helleri]